MVINKLIEDNYKIKISKDFKIYNLKKNDVYMVAYILLKKCTNEVWKQLLNKNREDINYEEICNVNYYLE